MINKLKNPFIYVPVLAIIASAGIFLYLRARQPSYEYYVVKRMDLAQEITATGRVKPAEVLDLAFEKSGIIKSVDVVIGQKVKIGQTLVRLQSGELSAQVLQAQANLEMEKADLEAMKKGSRPEEIQAAQTKLYNAQSSLEDAQDNLAGVQNKADADLKSSYEASLASMQKSVTVGKNALLTLTDIQFSHFLDRMTENYAIASKKAEAVSSLLGSNNADWWSSDTISKLKGGSFSSVQTAVDNSSYENIDSAISSVPDSLQKIKSALDAIPVITYLTSTEKSDLVTEKSNIDAEIAAISSKSQAISVQKTTNANNIISAQIALTTAENNVANAKDDLALKRAGSTQEQILAQEARVKSAQANLADASAQFAKTIINSPINGVVTKKDAKVGELASAGTPIISLMSEKRFEIEVNVPEADIAKMEIGDTAKVTLDAYGSDVLFQARVAAIDPAETIVEGVATYKTKLEFSDEDEKIKSGMTANIDILTDTRENVIAVPQRAVFSKDGIKMVKVLDSDNKIREAAVETGMRDSKGYVEISNGLQEEEKIITSEMEKK